MMRFTRKLELGPKAPSVSTAAAVNIALPDRNEYFLSLDSSAAREDAARKRNDVGTLERAKVSDGRVPDEAKAILKGRQCFVVRPLTILTIQAPWLKAHWESCRAQRIGDNIVDSGVTCEARGSTLAADCVVPQFVQL